MKHTFGAGCGAALILLACGASPAAAAATPAGAAAHARTATTADARFQAIHAAEWAWRVKEGLAREDDTRGRVSPELPRVDARSQQRRLSHWQGVLTQLDALGQGALSAAERVNYQVYRAQIAAFVEALRFREYEMPVNADSAFWTDVTYGARQAFARPDDYRDYLAQLADMPRYFGEQVENMRAGLARGFTPPRVTLKGRDSALASVAGARPEDTVFYTPFRDMPAAIPASEQAALRAQAVAAIRERVQPAYASTLAFVRDEYIPQARTSLAAGSLPGGQAYYASKIVEFTTTAMSADEIHRIGLAEMAKIRAEMADIIKQTGFQGDLPAFLQLLRTDPRFYAKTPEELLMRAAWVAKKFDARAGQYFGYLPRQRFAIRPVPDDQAPYYTAGRGGPGVYPVNTEPAGARALQPAGPDPARVGARPRLPGADRARAERRAAVSPRLHFGLWRRLGALHRAPRRRDGHLRDALRSLRDAELPGLARGAPGGRYRHPQQGLDARTGIGLPAREHRAVDPRSRNRGRPLHLVAGPGAVLLPGADGHHGSARQGGKGAGRQVRHPRLPRHRAAARLGTAAGALRAHRPLHRRGREKPLSAASVKGASRRRAGAGIAAPASNRAPPPPGMR
nr:DUF885 family protein [Massilia sp. Se16.2.3]